MSTERVERLTVVDDKKDKIIEDEDKKAPGATEELDPLEILLDKNARENLTDTVKIVRKGKGTMVFQIKAILGETYDEIQDKSTITKQNRAGQRFKEQDNRMLRRLVVLEGVTKPDLRDDRLIKAYEGTKGKEEELIEKILLPGEIDLLGDRILTLSGYTDDMVEVTKK